MKSDTKMFFLVFIALIFFIPLNVSASCNYSEVVRLKKIANNLTTSYNYVTSENSVVFNIIISNLHQDIYLYDVYSDKDYYYDNSSEINIGGFNPGVTARFLVKSNFGNCKGETISTTYVNLPNYNSYWNDPLCEGISEFSLCQKWTTSAINTYAAFKSEVIAYKLSLITDETEVEDEQYSESILSIVLQYILQYYYLFLIAIILICLIVIYRLRKKDTFGF